MASELLIEKIKWEIECGYNDKPEGNARQRRRALDDILDCLVPFIEMLQGFKNGNDEEQRVSREYERFLGVLCSYKEMLEADLEDADDEYRRFKDYFDSISE